MLVGAGFEMNPTLPTLLRTALPPVEKTVVADTRPASRRSLLTGQLGSGSAAVQRMKRRVGAGLDCLWPDPDAHTSMTYLTAISFAPLRLLSDLAVGSPGCSRPGWG
jgi:hypothetical protein